MRRRRSVTGHARRGVALLAALWLVVMITTAGLQFSTVARERRQLGLSSADRSRDFAALDGALAIVRAQLESESRQRVRSRVARASVGGTNAGADPWRDLSSTFALPIVVGTQTVSVRAIDLGTVVNVNLASETELATLIESVTGDATTAVTLSQAILDWRDADDETRPVGAEAERYARAGVPVRPANGPFGSVDELQDVLGMTAPRLAQLRPFLTVDGTVRRINVNAAPALVLRTLPGMTEPLLTAILALRSRARRVESIPSLLSAVRSAARPGSGEREALARQLSDAVSLDTRDVALTLTVSASRAHPASLVAVLHRNDDGTVDVGARRW